jgi:biopolymer transport protein ExbD
MVEAIEPATGTIALVPNDDTEGTVMLEAVEVEEAVERTTPVEVTEAIDVRMPVAGNGEPPKEPPAPKSDADDRPRPPMQPRKGFEETEMDMTPMVDVTFLLLIFFMVTATFTLQKSLEIPKPSDQDPSTNVIDPDPDDQGDFVTVKVDEYNTYFVTTVEWEEEAPSEQDLYVMLRRARDGDSTFTVPTKLRVEAHGDSLHEKVVSAIDAGTATGFDEVQLTTIEDD